MLDFVRPYKFTFTSDKWYLNLLLTFVAMAFVPIIGQIVITGYMFDQIERWHRRKSDADYEDIKLTGDDLLAYLTRGCWPFLIEFIQQILLTPISLAFSFYIMTQFQPGKAPDIGLIIALYGGMFATMIVLSLLISIVMTPMLLRAGLMQDFMAAFSMTFIGDFLRRTWGPLLAALVVQAIVGPLLAFGGMLVLCVGMVLTVPIAVLARYHFLYQLYELYLQRGGAPLPLKEPRPAKQAPPIAYE